MQVAQGMQSLPAARQTSALMGVSVTYDDPSPVAGASELVLSVDVDISRLLAVLRSAPSISANNSTDTTSPTPVHSPGYHSNDNPYADQRTSSPSFETLATANYKIWPLRLWLDFGDQAVPEDLSKASLDEKLASWRNGSLSTAFWTPNAEPPRQAAQSSGAEYATRFATPYVLYGNEMVNTTFRVRHIYNTPGLRHVALHVATADVNLPLYVSTLSVPLMFSSPEDAAREVVLKPDVRTPVNVLPVYVSEHARTTRNSTHTQYTDACKPYM